MDEDELAAFVAAIISEVGAGGMPNMGKLWVCSRAEAKAESIWARQLHGQGTTRQRLVGCRCNTDRL